MVADNDNFNGYFFPSSHSLKSVLFHVLFLKRVHTCLIVKSKDLKKNDNLIFDISRSLFCFYCLSFML